MTDNYVHLISPVHYNQIPDIRFQMPPPKTQLLGLGRILVQHDVHDHFGVHLLHRHFELEDGTVLFNNHVDDRTEISGMVDIQDLDTAKLHPHCFLLDDNGEFVSYEYEDVGDYDGTIPKSLTTDLTEYLVANNLQRVLALEKVGPGAVESGLYWGEYPLHETATIRKVVSDKAAEDKRVGIVGKPTGWVFHQEAGGVVTCENTCFWGGASSCTCGCLQGSSCNCSSCPGEGGCPAPA